MQIKISIMLIRARQLNGLIRHLANLWNANHD